MKSTSDLYISNLDHLRAVAAFLVFSWHFTHHDASCAELCYSGHSYVASNPLAALFEQGHTGVALFMCISGYIFTRLVEGKSVHVMKFWYNRLLRLFPLIIFWGVVSLFVLPPETFKLSKYVHNIFHPGGSWTVYLEIRYYALFPVLLFCMRKWKPLPVIALALLGTLAYRYHAWHHLGTVQEIAYTKLAGRGDQFLLGSAAFYIERWVMYKLAQPRRAFLCIGLVGLAGLLALYQFFNQAGGYYGYDGYPSHAALWIIMPTLEALFYSAILIAYLHVRMPAWPDRILSSLGKWSYSTYLSHFLLVPFLFIWIGNYMGMPDDFSGRFLRGAFIAFPIIIAISATTYTLIEKPFLRLRKPYLTPLA